MEKSHVFCLFSLLCIFAIHSQKLLDSSEDTLFDTFQELLPSRHRARRGLEEFPSDNVTYNCDTKDHPQPTADYPAVLFEGYNYNNCSANGKFLRIPANVFIKWGHNAPGPDRGRILTWGSILVYPGINISFRACCPSGNDFIKTASAWSSTANINLTVFRHPELQGNDGVWYQSWLHWVMDFYLRVNTPHDLSAIPNCGDCHFGSCGLTGKCECAPGYSGSSCDIRPANDSFPSQEKPLVLFKEENFQGGYVTANPNEFTGFASNSRSERVVDYKSVRILHNHTAVFSRNILFESRWNVGSDIYNIPDFMLANPDIANPLWYNYDTSIELTFYVQVVGNPRCDNCSITNGVCYTGSCVCVNGSTGPNCDTMIP